MEKRKLGRTGHMSSVLTLGGYAIGFISQREADDIMEIALDHGVNHVDVAPSGSVVMAHLAVGLEVGAVDSHNVPLHYSGFEEPSPSLLPRRRT